MESRSKFPVPAATIETGLNIDSKLVFFMSKF